MPAGHGDALLEAKAHVEHGRYGEAIAALRLAGRQNAAGRALLLAGLQREIGDHLYGEHDWDEAGAWYGRSLGTYRSIMKKQPDAPDVQYGYSLTLNRLGALLHNMGRWDRAIAVLRRAQAANAALLERDPENPGYRLLFATTQSGLGNSLSFLRRMEPASAALRQALGAFESLAAEDPENAEYRYQMAETQLLLGENEAAARTLAGLVRRHPGDAVYRYRLADARNFMGLGLPEGSEARAMYRRALGIFRKLLGDDGDNRQFQYKVALTLSYIGQSLIVDKRYAMALKKLEEAKKYAPPAGIVALSYGICRSMGLCHEMLGQPDMAYRDYLESIENVELVRGGFVMEEDRLDVMWDKADVYGNMVSLCVRMGDVERAWEFAERSKSRTLLDSLRFVEIRPPEGMPDRLRAGEAASLEAIKAAYARARGALAPEDEQALLARIDRLRADLDGLYAEMEATYPEYVELRRGTPLGFTWIAALLKRQPGDAAFVEYYATGDELVIFTMRSRDMAARARTIRLPPGGFRALYARFEQDVAFDQPENGESWQMLADYAIAPVLGDVDGCDMAYLVPHGLLHYFPLHALLADGQRLIERFPIAYAPSLSSLKYAQSDESAPAGPCLSLGYTPNAAERPDFEGEAARVAAIFGARPRLGSAATSRLLAGSSNRLVHLSCHGDFDAAEPLRSGLCLADRRLTAGDVFGLRMKADMLVMSACNTGQSGQRTGDELIGLARAFLYAGVNSLVVSLWAVDARATRALMEIFYRKWAGGGVSRAEALRHAQVEMIRGGKYFDPFFWAPFILIGDGR